MRRLTFTIGRRRLLGGLALLPLLRPVAVKAAPPIDSALAEALRSLGLPAEKVVWSSPLQLSAPAIADDGAAVPIGLKLPDTAAVEQIHVFAPANRRALAASIWPAGELLRPEWSLRIRLAKTQTVAAVARLADGRLVGAQAEVRVTTGGGCRP